MAKYTDTKPEETAKTPEAPATPAPTTSLTQEQLAAAIAAGMQLGMQQALQNQNNGATLKATSPSAIPECRECGQPKTGCKGKHEMMVVYPSRYPEFGRYFRGCIINNKVYLSNNENHEILVPTICKPGILNMIAHFEESERGIQQGRRKQHNSGSTSSPRPADAQGFR